MAKVVKPNVRPDGSDPLTSMWMTEGKVTTILRKLPDGAHSPHAVWKQLVCNDDVKDIRAKIPGEVVVYIEQGFKDPFDFGMPQLYAFTYYVLPKECIFVDSADANGDYHVFSGNLFMEPTPHSNVQQCESRAEYLHGWVSAFKQALRHKPV